MKKHHISISRILPFLMVCVLVCGTLSSCQSQPTATTKDNDISILTYDDWFHGVHIGDSDLKARSALSEFSLEERSNYQDTYFNMNRFYTDTKINNINVVAFGYLAEHDGTIFWMKNIILDTASDTESSSANYRYILELLTDSFGAPHYLQGVEAEIWIVGDTRLVLCVETFETERGIAIVSISEDKYQEIMAPLDEQREASKD